MQQQEYIFLYVLVLLEITSEHFSAVLTAEQCLSSSGSGSPLSNQLTFGAGSPLMPKSNFACPPHLITISLFSDYNKGYITLHNNTKRMKFDFKLLKS